MEQSNWDKFTLLIWKNWKLQCNRRSPLFEIIIPSLFCILLVSKHSKYMPDIRNSTIFNEVNMDLDLENNSITKFELVYSPYNVCLKTIMQNAANWLTHHNKAKHIITIHPVSNATMIENYMAENNAIVGIEFESVQPNETKCPKHLKYSMRFPSELRKSSSESILNWQTNVLFTEYVYKRPSHNDSDFNYIPSYIKEGFLSIQHAIALSFIKYISKNNKRIGVKSNMLIPDVFVRRAPCPPLFYGPVLGVAVGTILLTLLYTCFHIVKTIAAEKENRLKEIMIIMGIPNWLHWTAWFIKSYSLIVAAVCLIVVILKIDFGWDISGAVLTNTSSTALLFFMCIYGIAAVTFCLMFAVVFVRTSGDSKRLLVMWFVLYLPYKLTEANYETLWLSDKLSINLFCNSAFANAFNIILKLEATGEGLQWYNLFRPANVDDDLSVGLIIIMMLISSVLNMLIALYVEQILPSAYGGPKKWNFIFKKNFWCGTQYKRKDDKLPDDYESRIDSNAFEPEPTNESVLLEIKNLCKIFGDKIAVSELSMNLYENEITVLLGCTGAGKTTIISMLSGVISSTSGTAILNDYDIRNNLMKARKSLGLCPQHNILFDELTVREHLQLFSRLKGLRKDLAEKEVKKYVGILDLQSKIDTQSQHLPIGMKRKLSIGLALCGGSNVVLLDEPTIDVDSSTRRDIWKLLQSEKRNRTILLTTYFPNEADTLGDRVAIICNGDIKVKGSPFFLRKRFGAGYSLICVKKENCIPSQVTSLLRKYILDIEIHSDIGSELVYKLPEKYSAVFENMLCELEEKSVELNLSGYGISNTTLEEIFMFVCTEVNLNEKGLNKNPINSLDDTNSSAIALENDITSNDFILLSGCSLLYNQWKAMLLKKFRCTFRNYFLLIIQNSLAVFLVICIISVFKKEDNFKALQSLPLTIDRYPESVTVMQLQRQESLFLHKVGQAYKSYSNSFGAEHEFKYLEMDYTDFILKLAEEDVVRLNSQYLIGVTISSEKIVARFNAEFLHTAPLSLNAVHNALLRAIADRSYLIEVTNYPLPYSPETKLNALSTKDIDGFSTALSVCVIVISIFVGVAAFEERAAGVKLLQFISGVRIWIYWLSQFIVDFISFLITSILLKITLEYFQKDEMGSYIVFEQTFLVLLTFGLGSLPFTYLLSIRTKIMPACITARFGMFKYSVLAMVWLPLLILFLFVVAEPALENSTGEIDYKILFLLIPHYSLKKSLSSIYKTALNEAICFKACDYDDAKSQICKMKLCEFHGKCCDSELWTSEKQRTELNIIFAFISFFGFFFLVLWTDSALLYGVFNETLITKPVPPGPGENNAILDEDVIMEKLRISQMSEEDMKNSNILLNKVKKDYDQFQAVNEISVNIKSSECFGLLGSNGAGKTSTCKMLMGDSITLGEIYIKGLSICDNIHTVHRHIGYCPQNDLLLTNLTGRETLRMFALLHGIPERKINKMIEKLGEDIGLTICIDKKVREYNRINLRKLSISIALLGNRSIIIIDEPTTAMDTISKLQIWNKIRQMRDAGKSIVLTSQSVEECEALCTRLAIMVNGEFKCIGSAQHLKNKYSKGLTLEIRFKRNLENFSTRNECDTAVYFSNNNTTITTTRTSQTELNQMGELQEQTRIDELKLFVTSQFPEAVFKDYLVGTLTFNIPLSSIRWSKIFGIMESNKDALRIDEYSVGLTTLKDIFYEFVKAQRNPTEIKPPIKRKRK